MSGEGRSRVEASPGRNGERSGRGGDRSTTTGDGVRARSHLRRPAQVLRERVEVAEHEGRRRALMALLRRPLMTADGPNADDFRLVRRHSRWLREWLAHHAGWSLVDNAEVVRLHKVPGASTDSTRGAADPVSGVSFTRRRYVLFCLALVVIERGDRQTTLGHVASQVVALLAAEPRFAGSGLTFELRSPDERRDFVAVLRLLLDLGVLRRVEGEEERYVRDGSADVLYDVVRAALAALLSTRRSPSLVAEGGFEERLRAIVDEPFPDTADGRNRRMRTALARRLLDDPVVDHADLGEDERGYLESQRPFLMAALAEATGLEREERLEGLALVDPTGEASDIGLPEEGTDGHVTLLLATWLAGRLRSSAGVEIGEDAWRAQTAAFIDENRRRWRKDVTRPGAEIRIAAEVAARLEGLGLVRRTERGIAPRPAIGRYALRLDDTPGEEPDGR